MPQVILLHGLGGRSGTMIPLEKYLNCYGFQTTKLTYPWKTDDLETCIDHVADQIIEKFEDEEIIIIGQSMGGVIGSKLHTKNINIVDLVTIGSPVKGASILPKLRETLHQSIQDVFYKPLYEDLIDMLEDEDIQPPPHNYHCFTMSWPFSTFDGCVFADEARFDAENSTHLAWADHRSIFANPRLWSKVCNYLLD